VVCAKRFGRTGLILAVFLGACGRGAGNDAPTCSSGPAMADFPCEVGTVLQAKCQTCHTVPMMNNAKFSLLTYEDARQPFGTGGKERWQRMAEVIEPGAIPHMPYQSKELPDTPQLTDAELETLRAWFKACAIGANEGTGCDIGE
jgi:hypothetical protein